MIKTLPRFLLRQLYARPLAVFGAVMCLGVFLGSRIEAPLPCSVAVGVLSLGVSVAMYRFESLRLLCLGLILPLSLGIARYGVEKVRKPTVEAAYSVTYEGKVVSDVTRTDTERLVCALHVTRIEDDACDETVRLYLRSDERPLEGIEYGQTLQLNGHIWPQSHSTNPYQSDQVNWLKGLGFQGMASAKLEEVKIVAAHIGWQTPFIALRHALAARIDRLFPQSAALARAFILGDKTLLDADAREAFNNTGVAHIISLSGLHVAVLAFLLQKLLGKVLRRHIADALTLVFLAMYTALIGFPPSLVRAALMFAIVLGARL